MRRRPARDLHRLQVVDSPYATCLAAILSATDLAKAWWAPPGRPALSLLQVFIVMRAVCSQEGACPVAMFPRCAVCTEEGTLLAANGTSGPRRARLGTLLDANGTPQRRDVRRMRGKRSALAMPPPRPRLSCGECAESDDVSLGERNGGDDASPFETCRQGFPLGRPSTRPSKLATAEYKKPTAAMRIVTVGKSFEHQALWMPS